MRRLEAIGKHVLSRESWNPSLTAPSQLIDYIDLSAIDSDSKRIAEVKQVLGKDAPSRARQIVRTQDVLVSTVRPNLNGLAIVPENLDGATASTGFTVLRANEKSLSARYLYHWLKTPQFIADMVKKATGQSYPAVSDRIILESVMPLPQIEEQRRIAAILDQAEALRAKRRQALAKLKNLQSELFWTMFRSRLSSPAVSVEKAVASIPKGWNWRLLTDVARLATGHTPDRKRSTYWNGSIPWISLTDIRRLDGKIAHATEECVTEDGIANSSSVKLPPGTVCFSRTASVGFATVMGSEMATSQDFVNWVCGAHLNPVFLMHALIQSRRNLLSLANGSTHRTIYFPTVEQFHCVIPPIQEQDKFAAAVLSVEGQEQVMLSALSKMDDSFASLQHRAFRGEL